jgi:hypothetical protein
MKGFYLRLTMDMERCLSCGLKKWSEQTFRLLTLLLQTADEAMRALVLYSKDLSASPALPATQLGRLDYLSNMGLFWKMWIRSTGPQEKEDLSLPMKEYMNCPPIIMERMARPRAPP